MQKRVGARGYSIDLRERIVAAALKDSDHRRVAETFQVWVGTVRLYLTKHAAGTLRDVKWPTGRRHTVQSEHEQVLLQQLEEDHDASLEEHARRLEAKTGLKISDRTVDRVLRRHSITSKKNAGRIRTQ